MAVYTFRANTPYTISERRCPVKPHANDCNRKHIRARRITGLGRVPPASSNRAIVRVCYFSYSWHCPTLPAPRTEWIKLQTSPLADYAQSSIMRSCGSKRRPTVDWRRSACIRPSHNRSVFRKLINESDAELLVNCPVLRGFYEELHGLMSLERDN